MTTAEQALPPISLAEARLRGDGNLSLLMVRTGAAIRPIGDAFYLLIGECKAPAEAHCAILAFKLSDAALDQEQPHMVRRGLYFITYQDPQQVRVVPADHEPESVLALLGDTPRLGITHLASWASEMLRSEDVDEYELDVLGACRRVVRLAYAAGIAEIEPNSIGSTLTQWLNGSTNKGKLESAELTRLWSVLEQACDAKLHTLPRYSPLEPEPLSPDQIEEIYEVLAQFLAALIVAKRLPTSR